MFGGIRWSSEHEDQTIHGLQNAENLGTVSKETNPK